MACGGIQRGSRGARGNERLLFDPVFLISQLFPAPIAVQLRRLSLPAADFGLSLCRERKAISYR